MFSGRLAGAIKPPRVVSGPRVYMLTHRVYDLFFRSLDPFFVRLFYQLLHCFNIWWSFSMVNELNLTWFSTSILSFFRVIIFINIRDVCTIKASIGMNGSTSIWSRCSFLPLPSAGLMDLAQQYPLGTTWEISSELSDLRDVLSLSETWLVMAFWLFIDMAGTKET